MRQKKHNPDVNFAAGDSVRRSKTTMTSLISADPNIQFHNHTGGKPNMNWSWYHLWQGIFQWCGRLTFIEFPNWPCFHIASSPLFIRTVRFFYFSISSVSAMTRTATLQSGWYCPIRPGMAAQPSLLPMLLFDLILTGSYGANPPFSTHKLLLRAGKDKGTKMCRWQHLTVVRILRLVRSFRWRGGGGVLKSYRDLLSKSGFQQLLISKLPEGFSVFRRHKH